MKNHIKDIINELKEQGLYKTMPEEEYRKYFKQLMEKGGQ